jgi:hypothetical protein
MLGTKFLKLLNSTAFVTGEALISDHDYKLHLVGTAKPVNEKILDCRRWGGVTRLGYSARRVGGCDIMGVELGRTSCLPEVFPRPSGNSEPLAFAFLGASTPWVYALAVALAEKGHATAAIAAYDWGDLYRLRPSWPAGTRPLGLRCERWALPPGCVGPLERLQKIISGKRTERRRCRGHS